MKKTQKTIKAMKPVDKIFDFKNDSVTLSVVQKTCHNDFMKNNRRDFPF